MKYKKNKKNNVKIESSKTYGIVTAISMLINTAVGTGMLNLPNKIASASITVSIITIVLVGIILYICA